MSVENTVLVVSANFRKAYPVIKSLARMGLKVIAIFYLWRSPVFSKYIWRRYLVPNPYLDRKGYMYNVKRIIDKHKPSLTIPIGYIDVVTLAKCRHTLAGKTILPIPDYDTIVNVSRKDKIISLCKRLGIKYPQIYQSYTSVRLPAVFKSVYDASKPQYIFHAEDLDTIKRLANESTLIQEYIPGFGFGYFAIAKNGTIYVDYVHRRIIEEKPSGGASIVACIDFNPEVLALGRRIVKELRWTGAIMVEFKRHAETGEYYLLEINPKLWGSLELAVSKNIDIPRYIVEVFLYDRKPKGVTVKLNKRCFAWPLSGIHYLKMNPKIWFKILKVGLANGLSSTDIHINDPQELFYSIITRTINILLKGNQRRHITKMYANALKRFIIKLKKKNIQCIIFDLDYTLTKLHIKWGLIHKMLISKGLVAPWDTILTGLYKLRKRNMQLYKEASSMVKAYEDEAINKLEYNYELSKLLKNVKSRGIKKIAVVSKQEKTTVIEVLKKLGILEFFDNVTGREYSMLREEQISHTIKTLNIKPEESIMIGDQLTDAVAAIKNKMIPVVIASDPYRLLQYIELGLPCFGRVEDALEVIIKYM